ncbi:MAG: DUF4293 domain-containing protein [Lentimicrobium sp.]|nr:DUF4293 domain-containing protein [Lentimicrobium sp.]
MIQRVQSLYLFVAAAALVAIYFFPLASFFSDLAYYKFYMLKLSTPVPDAAGSINENLVLPLGIFNGLLAVVVFIAIFLFKNRRFQSKIVKLGILMNVILVGLIFFVFAPLIGRSLNAVADYSKDSGIYFTLVSLVMLILANRSIQKDEKMVRAADRLR